MRRDWEPGENEITPERLFRERRRLLKGLGAASLAMTFPSAALGNDCPWDRPVLGDVGPPTALRAIKSYNNYYEFSPEKEPVRILAQELTPRPWTITITGEVEQPLELDLDTIMALCQEERIYRLRCVEGWSMVIPWQGFPLSTLLEKAKPLSSGKFVRFVGTYRPSEMINQRRDTLDWPYTEGLRIDEATHPLTLVATGLYGKPLPPQNGAPLRLVVPWKYGFKSVKAFQTIEVVRQQPVTTWMKAAPSEYGFYANVNPEVPHPRWSQRRETRIGELGKRPTQMFNGYADQVAHLYTGMDLERHF
ncbi:MAG: protein-methionine-sulfoxide reductase catalytic subunit MsrP [Marinobacter sp.]|uniref:protein-methionine-sulfoxide reductase catalytic subunit MsrP n=1 Tax=Marinobacter sp. TaxID=50741 RepID=UPI00299D7571|nr:protein-methionine-sulfoxide reductase catalytic subunit MsrP [Marinobacter sp.]MDX1757694.1 protein-methionine-sulfoxide reductase catalytic subunit MsrP [Marinobacter sp.]